MLKEDIINLRLNSLVGIERNLFDELYVRRVVALLDARAQAQPDELMPLNEAMLEACDTNEQKAQLTVAFSSALTRMPHPKEWKPKFTFVAREDEP